MKKLLLALILLIPISLIGTRVNAQVLANYGESNTSLSTASNGVVAGTSFSIPSTYAYTVTWQMIADGSALSASLECSLDNSTYFIVDTQTTALGGTKNFGFTGCRFLRISQVSRTGGTATTGSFVIARGFINNAGGSPSGLSIAGPALFSDGLVGSPSIAFASEIPLGIFRRVADTITFVDGGLAQAELISTGGVNQFRFRSTSKISWSVTDDAANGSDAQFGRTAAGQIYAGTATTQPVINGTLFTSTTPVCTAADLVETTLFTYTLPAGALNIDGRGIRITAWAVGAANTNTKTLRVYFGATTTTSSSSGSSGEQWNFVSNVLRSSATAQVISSIRTTGGAASTQNGSLAETMANAIVIKFTGQNAIAAAGDICGGGMIVETIK